MDHGGQAAGSAADNIKTLKITAWLTGVYFVIELLIGLYSGSIAVVSDAFHTFSAVGGAVLALIASRISERPVSYTHTFGFKRAEIIGALFNGFFLFGMAFIVLWMGIKRLQNPIELPISPMLIAAFGGLITEFISLKILYQGQKDNLNMKGAFWHIIQTFVGSIIIIIAAVVIRFTGFYSIDPILGMLFGLVLFYASWGIIKKSLDILIQSVPQNINLKEVKNSIEATKGVKNVHHIHAWTLTSGQNIFSAHILIDSLENYGRTYKKAHKLLNEKFGFYFSTLQIETECLDTVEEPEDLEIGR